MSCLSWNCRGLGNPGTVQELANIVRVKAPSAVFLMETWSNEEYLEKVRCYLHFNSKLVVQSSNKGGGLVLFWNDDLNVSIKSYSHSHIDAIIKEGTEEAWRFTGVYGAPETHKREETWALLRHLDSMFQLPWCCIGDFNEIVKLEEMKGRLARPERQMRGFRNALDDCGLVDLRYRGFPYTWCNNRDPPYTTWVRLDRAVANLDWLHRFPKALVEHVEVAKSDHKCLWLQGSPPVYSRTKRRPFRFEETWMIDEGCETTIKTAWESSQRGTRMFNVWHKLKECKRQLGEWSRKSFGSLKKKIERVKQKIQQAEALAIQDREHVNINGLRRELNSLLGQEEKMWRQRSRISWLAQGDRNTKYFHGRATQRQRRNHISRLSNGDGGWLETNEEIAGMMIDYYTNLFSTSHPSNLTEAVAEVPSVVTEEMNHNLIREFRAEEVEHAIKQMAPSKAPGPDGMPPIFYQKYWHVVGNDVTSAVLSCLNSGSLLKSINHTFISLIPKVKNPEKVTEFRPISLCNVIYKLVSKVLANRLKLILPQVISDSQSAFVPGRLITDNVLIAFETLHHMHHNKVGREGAMALKLDMSKAYDRVEWRYLEQVMKRMGFHHKWIGLMTECISSVSYSILINGEPHGNIHPSRGLRQGDPLSPYLFLLCAEGLHSLIKKAESNGDMQGVSLCRGGPKITHLFFADDSLLFTKATTTACEKILSILRQYEEASGQQVNRDKTTIFFSKATPFASQSAIKDLLNVPIIRQYERYLGLPSLIGRNRAESFTQIKERVWKKLKGWKEKLLSQAGREVLIKAVAQAIPAYSMSCFRLPIQLCRELEVMIRRFWWSNNPEQNKINWVSWKKLCDPKCMGGMGFRDFQKFNEALLAKQVWRLMDDSSSLFYRVFKAKFFPHCSILETDIKTRGSYAWQSIIKAREVLLKGGVWRVGDGRKIKIWKTRWLLEDHHRSIVTHGPQLLQDCTVDQLILKPRMEWDSALIDKLFLPYDAEAIKNIPLSDRAPPDKFCWPGTANGLYTVKSGYHSLLHYEKQHLPGSSTKDTLQPIWNSVWSLQIPKKCQHFAWRASREALPTRVNLCRRRLPIDPTRENCRNSPEDVLHAVWTCPSIHSVWAQEDWTQGIRASPVMDFADLFSKVGSHQSDPTGMGHR
jgi:hypothetical protein